MRRAPTLLLALLLTVLALAAPASALTADRVSGTVRRHLGDVRACYEHALTLRRDLGGRIEVRFTVEAAGNVSAASVASDTVGDPSMQQCVLGAVRSWRFPASDAAETVTYPFQFSP